jgi:uncharacterized membrane protein YedE/YeeE
MTVAWENFTPLESFIGGGLIGLAALLLMALNGRIMGVSGIMSGVLAKNPVDERAWRVLFLSGAVLGPIVWQAIAGAPVAWQMVATGPQFYLAAFLVGVGTAIGSGCTSGHGICGLSRFSSRSFVAVLAFMASAVATVALLKLL